MVAVEVQPDRVGAVRVDRQRGGGCPAPLVPPLLPPLVRVDQPELEELPGEVGDRLPREVRAPRDLGARIARALDQVAGETLFVVHHRLEQMFGQNPLVLFANRDGLGRLQESPRPLREFFHVH